MKEKVSFPTGLPRTEKAILFDGLIYDLPEGRRVEVWRVRGEEGLCVRTYSPTPDGKESELVFGLRPKAAWALASLLNQQLDKLRKEKT